MWGLFKESIWGYLLGKVLTVLGTIETIWAVTVLAKPELGDALPASIDNRIWYGIALGFMFVAFMRMLKVASDYKKRTETTDTIRLVYNPKRYKACSEHNESEDKVIYRVGIRVIGNEAIEELIVIPTELCRIDNDSYKPLPIEQLPLHPMQENTSVILRGLTPSYYVDVISHIVGSQQINICHNRYESEPIYLENGIYVLILSARAKPRTIHTRTMKITMLDGNIDIEVEQRDYLG
ncbi:hypothetical protein ACFLUL_01920 [Chloroflexota bacterium]